MIVPPSASDFAFDTLHAAGWSIGDVGGPGRWIVSGQGGEPRWL
jgi:DNA-binding helix-hairpin-helix protein with protein kinase domain